MEETPEPSRSIQEVMAENREAWMGHPNVTGMGVGRCDGEPCIVLYLLRRPGQAEQALPDSVGGYPVRREVTGQFEARPPDDTAEDGT